MQKHELSDLDTVTDIYGENSLPFPITERDDWRHVCIQFAFKGWRHPHATIEPSGDALITIMSSVEEKLDNVLCITDGLDSSTRMDQIRMTMERIGTLISQVYPPKVLLGRPRNIPAEMSRVYKLKRSRRGG